MVEMQICDGEIKGDPDIAGTGVVAAIFINTIVGIFLAGVIWFYVIVFAREIRLERLESRPRFIMILSDTLLTQGDSQLVSGLAIIIASLVNIYKDENSPLYHIFIARSLADTCLTSHLACVILLQRTEHNWTFRLCLLGSTLALWEYWSYLAIQRFRRWGLETPHCFENDSIVPGEYEHWIYISLFWMPLSYAPVFLNSFLLGRRFTYWFERRLKKWPPYIIRLQKDIFESRSSTQAILIIVRSAVLTLSCLVFLVFTVMIPASFTLLPFQSFLSFWWTFYDVSRARAANAHILVANPPYRMEKSFQNNENPESDWGFGQILPMVMLLLPILTYLDNWKRSSA